MCVPELGLLVDVLVAKRLGNVVGGVELGRFGGRKGGVGRLVVGGEGATILGLYGPQAPLVVHAGAREAPNASYNLLVARR